jgi:hypothetical protein
MGQMTMPYAQKIQSFSLLSADDEMSLRLQAKRFDRGDQG